MKLEPLILKGFFKKSICKLAQDEFYTDVILRQEFNECKILVSNGKVLISPGFLEA